MMDLLLILWFVLFIFFMAVNIHEKSFTFGTIAGLWMILLAVFIAVDGIQTESGAIITHINDSVKQITYQYSDVTLPYSTYSYVWGIVFSLLGIVILWFNITLKFKGE